MSRPLSPKARRIHIPGYTGLDAYREAGYRLLEARLAGERKPEDLIQILEHSGLRGFSDGAQVAPGASGTFTSAARRQCRRR
jgi:hypothetical protein